MGHGQSEPPFFLPGRCLQSFVSSELFRATNRLAAERVQDVWLEVRFTLEVEHVQQRPRKLTK